MPATTRLGTTLVVLTLLLAGCGQGDPDAEPSATPTTPAPLPTEEAELKAALPSLEQVPGGSRIDLQCPQDEDRCGEEEDPSWAFGVQVEPAGNPVEIERNSTTATPNDVAVTSITLPADEEAAAAYLERQREGQEATDGTFDIPAQPVDGGGQIPASSGTGSLEDTTLLGLEGYLSSYTLVSPETDEPAQRVAQLLVRDGRVLVGSFVSLSAPGRDAEAAAELARRLVRDTVERLRKGAATFTR